MRLCMQDLPALKQLNVSGNPLRPDDVVIRELRERPDVNVILDEMSQEAR